MISTRHTRTAHRTVRKTLKEHFIIYEDKNLKECLDLVKFDAKPESEEYYRV